MKQIKSRKKHNKTISIFFKIILCSILICFSLSCKLEKKINQVLKKITINNDFEYVKGDVVTSFQYLKENNLKFLIKINLKSDHNFLFKTTEITNYNWYVIHNEYISDNCGLLCPKKNNSFLDAIILANLYSKKEKFEECYIITKDTILWPNGYDCLGYRLPTMAEWWLALGNYHFQIYNNSNTYLVAGLPFQKQPEIASKMPNNNGIYDMYGSMSEFLWNDYTDHLTNDYSLKTDKKIEKNHVIIKDCPWWYKEKKCDLFLNNKSMPLNVKQQSVGIRLVRTIE